MEQDEGTIVGQENLKTFISEYYKKLCGAPVPIDFSLIEANNQDMPQISLEENDILTQDFIEKVVFDAINQRKYNKSPDKAGFLPILSKQLEHYKIRSNGNVFPITNWGLAFVSIKIWYYHYITQKGAIPTRLPPNVSFKIFTKVGTNRVTSIASRVIRPIQTAFIPGRNILDGVLFKIFYGKAYDKVKWSFLQQVLRMKGFAPQWCEWMARFVQGGSVGIRVNDDIGHYFH